MHRAAAFDDEQIEIIHQMETMTDGHDVHAIDIERHCAAGAHATREARIRSADGIFSKASKREFPGSVHMCNGLWQRVNALADTIK
jgi:hypothetical protein